LTVLLAKANTKAKPVQRTFCIGIRVSQRLDARNDHAKPLRETVTEITASRRFRASGVRRFYGVLHCQPALSRSGSVTPRRSMTCP